MAPAVGYFRLMHWSEASHPFVIFKQGARAGERDLLEFARANLAQFKGPHSVTFVKELPKTATGKIQRENGNLSYPDIERAFPIVTPIKKQKGKTYEHNYNERW